MIAALPMYDRRETAGAHDRLWAAIRDALRDVGQDAPEHLSRDVDLWETWHSPDLVLGQTCGLPYRARLHDKVALVGAPVWDLPCPPGLYYSVLVVRRDDRRESFAAFDGARLAWNDPLSQSGWAAAFDFAASANVTLRPEVESGSHRASARLVAEGTADIAALDAVTWRMIERYDAEAAALRVLTETPPTPALPYIAAQGAEVGLIRAALAAGIAALSPGDRDILGLKGVVWMAPERYRAVPIPPDPRKVLDAAG